MSVKGCQSRGLFGLLSRTFCQQKRFSVGRERGAMAQYKAASSSTPRGLAGEYHSSDFSWEELKVDAEKVLSEKSATYTTPEVAVVEERMNEQGKRWEGFHKLQNNTAKFFKERRYILQEFPQLLGEDMRHVIEFGCGNGSTVIPLLKGNPVTKVTAVDFSESAVIHAREAVKQAGLDTIRCEAFTCDLSQDLKSMALSEQTHENQEIGSIRRLDGIGADAVLMMFMLSAVPPHRMKQSILNAYNCLKPGGYLFFRDYGMYDLTQLRLPQEQRLGKKVYHRGDGTLTYFFTLEELKEKFEGIGFDTVETDYVCVELYNRKKDFQMKRVFAHAIFRKRVTPY